MFTQTKADMLLIFITAIWGLSFTLMKNVLVYMSCFSYLSIRFIIATLVVTIVFSDKLKNANKKLIILGSVIGLFLFGGMALQVAALYYTSASNAAFITGLNIVMVPVISALLLKKIPDKSSIIGVVCALVGLFLFTGGIKFRFNFGDFLTLLAALCFAFQIIFIDKYTENHDSQLLAVFQILFAKIFYVVVWLSTDLKPIVINSTVIVTLLITGVISTALAYTGQTVIQKYTSPTRTAVIFAAEPVFGLIFALLIPNSRGITEVLKLNNVVGCILILLAIAISQSKTLNKFNMSFIGGVGNEK